LDEDRKLGNRTDLQCRDPSGRLEKAGVGRNARSNQAPDNEKPITTQNVPNSFSFPFLGMDGRRTAAGIVCADFGETESRSRTRTENVCQNRSCVNPKEMKENKMH
jgi:hypothetical protein